MRRLALVVGLWTTPAWADDGGAALQAAQQRAAAGDARAIETLEELGAARPITRWTDDAWRSAAQLAERARDFSRARRAFAEAAATATDATSRARAQSDVARLDAMVGPAGQWADVAGAHDRLAQSIRSGRGDPAPALRELEALVRDSGGYPGATNAMLVIAEGWERDDEPGRAIDWLHRALASARPAERLRVHAALARTLIRAQDLDAAREVIPAITDPGLAADLRGDIATAERRRAIRRAVLAILVALVGLATVALRRTAGSWRVAGRRLVRPPVEVLYYVPIAALLAVVAQTGNPAAGRAVVAISVVGCIVAWISGVLFEGRPRPSLPRLALHVALCALAVLAAAYLVIDQTRLTNVLIETWRGGHELH